MTMKAAFETLELPTWHWVEMAANPPDMDMWSEAFIAKFDPALAAKKGIKPFGREEFDNLLGYWGATTDHPAAVFCEELVKAYPEAKVALVERDVEQWYKSYYGTVIDGTFSPWIPLARLLDPVFMRRTCYVTDLLMKHYFGVTLPRQATLFTNDPESKRMYIGKARETYRKHNEMVKRVTPKERLLVFKLEDGWKPLCEFLGKPVPDVPFPKVNETAVVQELIKVYIANSYKRALGKMLWRLLQVAPVVMLGVVWARWSWS